MNIILIAFFLLCVLYSFMQSSRFRVLPWFLAGLSIISIYFVLFPESTTIIANYLGIGRGADLILYIWVIITIILFFFLKLKLRAYHQELTSLSRVVAINNATRRETEE